MRVGKETAADMLAHKDDLSYQGHGKGYMYRILNCRCAKCCEWKANDDRKRAEKRERDKERKLVEEAAEKAKKDAEIAWRTRYCKRGEPSEYKKSLQRKAMKSREKHSDVKKDVCTVQDILKPLFDKGDIDNEWHRCMICGKPATNLHHIIRRGSGKWIEGGHEHYKTRIRLCGSGTTGCHGKVHDLKLHFRWVRNYECKFNAGNIHDTGSEASLYRGHLEYIETDEPMKYEKVLAIEDGWKRVGYHAGE